SQLYWQYRPLLSFPTRRSSDLAHTGDSFVLSQLVSVLPALLLALGGVVVKAGQMLDVQNQHGFFLMGLSFAACFPFLRMAAALRSEEHTSELQSRFDIVCRLLL